MSARNNGGIPEDDSHSENEALLMPNQNRSTSTSSRRQGSQASLSSWLQSSWNTRNTREFDIFGFYLSLKHSLIALFLSIIMCGPMGSVIILVALGLYHRMQSMPSFNSSSSSQRRNNNGNHSRGSGGWGAGGNIRGVSDLPCDPKGG